MGSKNIFSACCLDFFSLLITVFHSNKPVNNRKCLLLASYNYRTVTERCENFIINNIIEIHAEVTVTFIIKTRKYVILWSVLLCDSYTVTGIMDWCKRII